MNNLHSFVKLLPTDLFLCAKYWTVHSASRISAMSALESTNRYSSDSNAGSSEASGSERRFAKVNRVPLDKNSAEYRKRREKNNAAVRKSRDKSKLKAQETAARVLALKQENEQFRAKIDSLNKELELLKNLFLAHSAQSQSPGEAS